MACSTTDPTEVAAIPTPELPIHINALVDAVVITDAEYRIVRWNRAAEELYGYTADEAMGQDALALLLSPGSDIPYVEMNERLERGTSWSGILTLQRKDGTEFTARITDSPVRDPDGTLVAVICVAYDVHGPSDGRSRYSDARPAVDPQFALDLRHETGEVLTGERPLDLSPTESDLLEFFVTNAGQVMTHDDIARAVWGYETGGSTNFVQAAVSRLRRKLRDAGSPALLSTVRGRGYVLRAP